MRIVTSFAVAALCVAAAVASATSAAQSRGPQSAASKELFDELAGKDAALFDAVFNTCNVDRLGELLTEDFEFYHDKAGLTATSGAQFVELIRGMCERQKKGVDYRARRELVKSSLEVYPLNNYGAIQMGVHRFYRLTEGKGEKLTEVAKFTHVWKKENGGWRLARVLSYDHQDVK